MFRQSETQIAQKTPHKPRGGRWGVALLISVILSLSVFCLPASALTSINCVVAQPQLNGKNFYAEVNTANNWHWLIIGEVSSISPISANDLVFSASQDSTYLNFFVSGPLGGTQNSNVKLSVVYIDMWNGKSYHLENVAYNHCRQWLGSSGKVSGIHGYNVDVTSFSSSVQNDFVINYATDGTALDKLDAILAKLDNSATSTETAVDNANKKAEEREKQETQKSGDNASSDTSSAMPSVDEGFANSLKSFVGSMSYNGTEAILPIPKTSIPAIEGVMGEVVLIPEQGYDLSSVITQYIPANLLQLVQHLFTIALVLYCVYELYSLIQYVLTLKKGGKDE
jgi:hypothetical protein